MHFMRIPLVAAALTAVTLTSVNAMDPWVTERAQSGNAAQGERQASGGFSTTALSRAPGVLNALADDNNTLVYVRVSQARYAAYYNDARSRCAMYRGKAGDTCVDEARMKYGQPLANPPL
ncbi:MAG: hypothetical protein Q8R61_07085 [Thiobacillus sp.]|uniref:hypothetical protein n=1 Tax=Thiobacillus sp. TaxID=924 RepID=UPI002737607A|nr:hypothetical protein [Thiobacillus sp.]MDP3584870.1 hypothetical protein [Thiobacillus sp.]